MTNNTTQNYDPKEWEDKIKSSWSKSKFSSPDFEIISLKSQSVNDFENQTYTIIVPPPNLTGDLHSGHAFEHFMMDSISRMARQRQFKTLYFPGVDHAGIQLEGVINKLINSGHFDDQIPTLIVDKLLAGKITNGEKANFIKQTDPDLWLRFAWEKVGIWRNNQLVQAKTLGDSPDFNRLLFTLDPKSVNMVNHAFQSLYKNGLIYKGSYIINWSTALQTALSDVPEDISHIEILDPFILYQYRLESVEILDDNETLFDLKSQIHTALNEITIGTVRVETAPASMQIMSHPDSLKSKILETCGISPAIADQIIEGILSGEIVINYQIPVLDIFGVKLYLDDSLDPNFGTGMMKITPAHDPADYALAAKHGIRNFPTVIGRDGNLTENVNGKYSKMPVKEARIRIIVDLIKHGFVKRKGENVEFNTVEFDLEEILKLDYNLQLKKLGTIYPNYQVDWAYSHSVVICERSKTQVEPMISEEFFLDYKKEFNHKPNLGWKFSKLDFSKIKIETEDLTLQTISLGISDFILDNFTKNDSISLITPDYSNLLEIQTWIIGQNTHMAGQDPKFVLSIIDKKTDKYIGYCGWRIENNQNKLTIWIADQYRGQGFGAKSIETLLDWVWENFDTNEIYWEVKDFNISSINLVEKLGFKKISIHPYSHPIHNSDQFADGNYYVYVIKRPVQTLQNLTLGGINQVNFLPNEYKQRGLEYFQNIKNWCISRSLIWGIKIPIWYNLDTNPAKVFYEFQESGKYLNQFQISQNCPDTPGTWVQEEKVLDTWFSSTLWPLSTLDFAEFDLNNNFNCDFANFYPTQTMTSAWEIFYAWILRMIMMGKYFTNTIPFENYCCHAWVLDENGRKMSKSLGNVFDPVDQINKFSVDSTRLGLLSGAVPGKNIRFQGKLADNLCVKYRNFGNKLWNITRFFNFQFELNKIDKSNINIDTNYVNKESLSPASLWILSKFQELISTHNSGFENYNFAQIIDQSYIFAWDGFASWYLEYLKTDKSQLEFGYRILKEFIILISPIIPFQSQVIFDQFFGNKSVLIAEIALDVNYLSNIKIENSKIESFEIIISFVNKIRSLKGLFGFDPVLEITALLGGPSAQLAIFKYRDYIFQLTKVKIIPKEIELETISKYYQLQVLNLSLFLDLVPHISTLSIEIEKTEKQTISIQSQINQLEMILSDTNFINRGQKKIIEKKQQDLAARKSDLKDQNSKMIFFKNISKS